MNQKLESVKFVAGIEWLQLIASFQTAKPKHIFLEMSKVAWIISSSCVFPKKKAALCKTKAAVLLQLLFFDRPHDSFKFRVLAKVVKARRLVNNIMASTSAATDPSADPSNAAGNGSGPIVSGPSNVSSNQPSSSDREQVYVWIQELGHPDTREAALLELSKKRVKILRYFYPHT